MAKVWQDKRLLLWVGVCLVVGTAIRLANLFHLGFVFDTTETQHTWAMFANQMGLFNFWKNYAGPFDYAPGSLLLLMGIKAVASWFSQSAVAFVAGIKLLNWAADMSIAWCAYWLARRSGNPQRGIMVAALVYILPSLWFVSSVWGQIDSPVMAMVLWSVVLLHDGVSRAQPGKFWQNRVFWSGVLWAIAYWIKMQAVLILPVFILIYLSQQARTKVRWHITGILAVCVPMLVVFMTNPIRLVVVMAGIFGRSNDIAGGSATFWPLIGVTGTADHSIIAGLGLSVNHLALVIYGVVMLFVLAKIYGVQMTLQKSFRKHMQDWHDKLLELPNLSKIILVMTLSSAVYYLFFPKSLSLQSNIMYFKDRLRAVFGWGGVNLKGLTRVVNSAIINV